MHIHFQLKTSDDYEIYQLDQVNNTKINEICEPLSITGSACFKAWAIPNCSFWITNSIFSFGKLPLTSSLIGSTIDTFLFFSISFYATGIPWVTLSLGDLAVKILVALVMLIPFRLLLGTFKAVKA